MNNEERMAKLNKAIKIFTVFKFVGLGLLIIGGILFSIDLMYYIIDLFDAMTAGNEDMILNAFVTFIVNGTLSLSLLMLGLAALIVFSILRKKKKAEYVKLQNSTAEIL